MYQADLCRFDSPPWLGRLLVDSIAGPAPDRVVDLGSGGGGLALAALEKWQSSRITTLDLDRDAATETTAAMAASTSGGHEHIVADVLANALPAPHLKNTDTGALVVSNPPYRSTPLSPEIEAILARAGIAIGGVTCKTIPTDVVFLAQALELAGPGGRLGLIVPDMMISGQRFRYLRAELLRRHTIERVVQLPRRCFKGTEAQAFVMAIRCGITGDAVKLDAVGSGGTWRETHSIPLQDAAERMDYEFYEGLAGANAERGVSLRQLGVQVQRGRLSSTQLAHAAVPTLHTNGFPQKCGELLSLSSEGRPSPLDRMIWVETGDILVARVDRHLEEKIAVVSAGAAALSDCVFRVRCEERLRERVLKGLVSESGRRQLKARARGTGARHISAASLLEVTV